MLVLPKRSASVVQDLSATENFHSLPACLGPRFVETLARAIHVWELRPPKCIMVGSQRNYWYITPNPTLQTPNSAKARLEALN